MVEPIYHSVREFAETYRFTRSEINHLIGTGVIEPRRIHGNTVLTETDMMKIVQYNTAARQKKNPARGQANRVRK